MVKTSIYLRTAFIFSFLLVLSSCLSVKPGATKSGKKYYETFFVGEEGSQYFIKPFTFENSKLKEEVHLDLTFRYKNKINSNATINYSLFINEIIKEVDSISIVSSNIIIKSTENKLLFNERVKTNFKSRFSTEAPLSSLKQLFENENWEIQVYANNKIHVFRTTKKPERK